MNREAEAGLLEIQAYVDGALSPEERSRVEARLIANAEDAELALQLKALSHLLKSSEPEAQVPVSREFYWSQIERSLRLSPISETSTPAAVNWLVVVSKWLRWAAPGFGIAAVAALLLVSKGQGWFGGHPASLGLNHEVETSSEDTVAFTFRSENAGMSVVWVAGRHDF